MNEISKIIKTSLGEDRKTKLESLVVDLFNKGYKTQVEIAEKTGVSRQRINQIFNDNGVNISAILSRLKRNKFEDENQVKDLEGEIWLYYKVEYHVSNLGRVKRVWQTQKGKREKLIKSSDLPYNRVNINKTCYYVHRMVAERFVKRDFEYQVEVNHKNKNKTDNRAINLEWCTKEENVRHGNSKYFVVVEPSGREVIVDYLKDYCLENDIHYRVFLSNKVCKGFKLKQSLDKQYF